jgi:predicted XRE-type DNA-binding protein
VFEDIGLPDSAALLAKAELVSRICAIIEERGLTQTQAARLLGVSQPKISALMRGKLDGFSSDRLFRFLNLLGRDIEVVIKVRRRSGNRPCVRVIEEKRAGRPPVRPYGMTGPVS